jgi:hypothetical protein
MDWPFSEENAATFGGWYEALLRTFLLALLAHPTEILKKYPGTGVAVRLEKGDHKAISLKVASANWGLRAQTRCVGSTAQLRVRG